MQLREEDLQAYVDGRLDVNLRADVEAFLALHPVEGERINAYRAQNVALHHAFDVVTREPLPMSIEDMADKLSQIRPETVSHRVMRAGAVSAALLLAVAAGWFAHGQWPAGGPAQTPSVAAVVPNAVVSQPVVAADVSAPLFQKGAVTGDALVGWLLQQAPTSFRTPPDLESVGLSLAGGRILQNSNKLVVQLVYQGAGRVVSLYVCAGPQSDGAAGFPIAEQAGLSSLYWRQGNLEFTLVGPMPEQQLLGIAQFIQAQHGAPVERPAETGKQLRSVSSGNGGDVAPKDDPGLVKPAPALPADGGTTPEVKVPPEPVEPLGENLGIDSVSTGRI